MKKESLVHPLLQYLTTIGTEYVFRQVATLSEFEYYLDHLSRLAYSRFDIIYLCFHGKEGEIAFANGESISLTEIAEKFPGIFNERKVHFGSCSTLNISCQEVFDFKEQTRAKLVTGYAKKVDFHQSFLFELWLMHLFPHHKSLGPSKLEAKVEKEMKFYGELLKFRIF
ncbi:MAG: hypothetical protein K2K98_11825 [Muribaculaceae bacterium]|nr:hypothetical protein [Muribaculaceae bacterium]